MNPVQYIILNKGAKMSTGKASAQTGHAAVLGYKASCRWTGGNWQESSIVNRWFQAGHYTKIVLEVPDEAALFAAERYITERNIKVSLVLDEGRTEFDGRLTPTALGSEIVDKDSGHVGGTFGQFKLYRDNPPTKNPWWRLWPREEQL